VGEAEELLDDGEEVGSAVLVDWEPETEELELWLLLEEPQ
jgi:hypothetical protein